METKIDTKRTVQALAALAQETRLGVYRLLVEAGPTGLAAGEIGAELKLAPATLSFHLKELSRADLISARQDGRYIYYSANFAQMGELVGFLTENCCERDGMSCSPTACRPSSAIKAVPRPASGGKPSYGPKITSPVEPKRKGIKA